MTTYPGLPGPIVCDFISREESRARYAPETEFQIGKIELVSNTGTYVDTPFHRYADGERPVHTALLGAGIPIVEHMTGLAHVPDGARFFAVPPPIEGMGTFPVRAFAVAG